MIRGIPETKDEVNDDSSSNWEATRNAVCLKLSEIIGDDADDLSESIERIHRGQPNNKGGPRVVHLVFHDWNNSERLKKEFKLHGKGTGIFIDQRYGPETSFRRNKALQRRRELIDNGTITSSYVKFPAKLMVKYNQHQQKYTMQEDFSKIPIPVNSE